MQSFICYPDERFCSFCCLNEHLPVLYCKDCARCNDSMVAAESIHLIARVTNSSTVNDVIQILSPEHNYISEPTCNNTLVEQTCRVAVFYAIKE